MLRGIHKLCDKKNWDDVKSVLEDTGPDGVAARKNSSRPGGYGEWTPLHLVCRRDPPVDVVQLLCNVSLSSTLTYDLYNKLPIHYAAINGSSLEVIKALVDSCPESVVSVDGNGYSSLHLTLIHARNDSEKSKDEPARAFPSSKEISLLLGSDSRKKDVVMAQDISGFTPLHWATSKINHCDYEVFRTLIEVDVNCIVVQNDEGMTPLQLALRGCSQGEISLNIIRLLVGIFSDEENTPKENIDPAQMIDNNNWLPIHYACMNWAHVPIEVFQLLLKFYPRSATHEVEEEGFPLDILEQYRETLSIDSAVEDDFNAKSDLLFSFHPDIKNYRQDKKRLTRIKKAIIDESSLMTSNDSELSVFCKSLWIWLCTFPDEEDTTHLYSNIVAEILKAVPNSKTAKILATMKMITTKEGVVNYLHEFASNTAKRHLMKYLRFVDRYEIKKGTFCMIESTKSITLKACDGSTVSSVYQNVLIKFFSDSQAFKHEVSIHEKIGSYIFVKGIKSPILPMVQYFDMDRIGTQEETQDDKKFARDILQIFEGKVKINPSIFRYALVQIEVNDGNCVSLKIKDNVIDRSPMRCCLRDIGKLIHCLQSAGFILGQVKMSDFTNFDGDSIVLKHFNSILSVGSEQIEAMYFGSISSPLINSTCPPEMVAKIDHSGVQKYNEYWSQVTQKFTDIVDGNIKPRKVGNDYFVIKCFSSGFKYEDLPYPPLLANESLSAWIFGCLIFEQLTDATLFHCNKLGEILINDDYKMLHNWNIEDSFSEKRIELVYDPLARDLLRNLLQSNVSKRQSNMDSILKHPFFGNESDEETQTFCSHIELKETEKMQHLEMIQQEKLELDEAKEVLSQRTDKLLQVSLKTQLRFERSQWKQIQWNYDLNEVCFPTSSILLPYKLEKFGDNLLASLDDFEIVSELGLCLADVLHYVSFSQKVEQNWSSKDTFDETIQKKILKMSKVSDMQPGTNFVPVCKTIVKLTTDVESILKSLIGTNIAAEQIDSVARKLVRDTLDNIVDLEICDKVVKNAGAAQTALTSLLHTVAYLPVENSESTENMLHKKMEELVGEELSETCFKALENARPALFTLIESFAQDTLEAVNHLLDVKVNALINIYSSHNENYAHLIDEYSGTPLSSSIYPLEVPFSSTMIQTFIPLSIMSLKSNFPLGLHKLLGVSSENIPEEWLEFTNCFLPSFSKEGVESEFIILQKSFTRKLEGVQIISRDDILDRLEELILDFDQDREFSELRRLCSPTNLILWSTKDRTDIILKEAKNELDEFELLTNKRACEEMKSLATQEEK